MTVHPVPEGIPTDPVAGPTVEQLLAALARLHEVIHGRTIPLPDAADDRIPLFTDLYHDLVELRVTLSAMARGDLATASIRRNFLSAALKSHQANLFHLTWQAQMVAAGDF